MYNVCIPGRLRSSVLILIVHHFLPAAAQGKPSSPSRVLIIFPGSDQFHFLLVHLSYFLT